MYVYKIWKALKISEFHVLNVRFDFKLNNRSCHYAWYLGRKNCSKVLFFGSEMLALNSHSSARTKTTQGILKLGFIYLAGLSFRELGTDFSWEGKERHCLALGLFSPVTLLVYGDGHPILPTL